MKPGTRMLLNRCASVLDAVITIALAFVLFVTCGFAFVVATLPALPVVVTLAPSPLHQPNATKPNAFAGDSMKAKPTTTARNEQGDTR